MENGDAVALQLTQMGQHVSGTAMYLGTGWSPRFYVDLEADRLFLPDSRPGGQGRDIPLEALGNGIGGPNDRWRSRQQDLLPAGPASRNRPSPPRDRTVLPSKGTAPEYTEEAHRAKLQGTVLVFITVDEHGQATNPLVVRGLGMGLDEKAVEAVKKWRFTPGKTQNGTRVSSDCTVGGSRLSPVTTASYFLARK